MVKKRTSSCTTHTHAYAVDIIPSLLSRVTYTLFGAWGGEGGKAHFGEWKRKVPSQR